MKNQTNNYQYLSSWRLVAYVLLIVDLLVLFLGLLEPAIFYVTLFLAMIGNLSLLHSKRRFFWLSIIFLALLFSSTFMSKLSYQLTLFGYEVETAILLSLVLKIILAVAFYAYLLFSMFLIRREERPLTRWLGWIANFWVLILPLIVWLSIYLEGSRHL